VACAPKLKLQNATSLVVPLRGQRSFGSRHETRSSCFPFNCKGENTFTGTNELSLLRSPRVTQEANTFLRPVWHARFASLISEIVRATTDSGSIRFFLSACRPYRSQAWMNPKSATFSEPRSKSCSQPGWDSWGGRCLSAVWSMPVVAVDEGLQGGFCSAELEISATLSSGRRTLAISDSRSLGAAVDH
jgi:hypothetical protein